MQEDIENKSLTLIINTGKLTGRTMATAFMKLLRYSRNKLREHRDVKPQGKQSVKKLIGQNQGVSTIESNDPDIKSFERIARKYGVDYAIKKVRTEDKPKFVIFFKARDADALTQAFTEYTRKSTVREKRPSVLEKLHSLTEKMQNRILERTKTRQRSTER